MKQGKKNSTKIAKILFGESLTHQKLDRQKIKSHIQKVKVDYKKSALEILKVYFALIKRYQKEKTLVIESANQLKGDWRDEIKSYFKKTKGYDLDVQFITNPKLLGGLKVTQSDWQWDFSVKGKIVRLKEVLGG